MSKIDPHLVYMQQQSEEAPAELFTMEGVSSEGRLGTLSAAGSVTIDVFLQFTGDLDVIEAAGFSSRTVAGDVATGTVPLDALGAIAALPNVVKVESSRPLSGELNQSLVETRCDRVTAPPLDLSGEGVLVGIIDFDIDFTHANFLNGDGTSRIVALWDQGLSRRTNESGPSPTNGNGAPRWTLGVEYTKPQIDAALQQSNPQSTIRSQGGSGHGTHVAGIAAGNGSARGGTSPTSADPSGTYRGMAPNADLIVVENRMGSRSLGDSTNTLDAVAYILAWAEALGRPVVINLSQGDNVGAHDGTSLLERALDNLLGDPGRILVKSAGNAANDNIHVGGELTDGTTTLQFIVPPPRGNRRDTQEDIIDIWYAAEDRVSVQLVPPGLDPTAAVAVDETRTFSLGNGNSVFIISTTNDPNNGDNRIYIRLMRGSQATIQSGTWGVRLNGDNASGRYDAWIQRTLFRNDLAPTFVGADASRTISIPGTSQKIIAVASYDRGGGLSNFSSLGPTRDGRGKPEVGAPGRGIISALARGSGRQMYTPMSGTSMAAPHVTGAIALLLQRNPYLTQGHLRNFLSRSCRSDRDTDQVPNNSWGAGKLDVEQAANCGLAQEPVLHMMMQT